MCLSHSQTEPSNVESSFQYCNYLSNAMNVSYWDRNPNLKTTASACGNLMSCQMLLVIGSLSFLLSKTICLFKKLINTFSSLYLKS